MLSVNNLWLQKMILSPPFCYHAQISSLPLNILGVLFVWVFFPLTAWIIIPGKLGYFSCLWCFCHCNWFSLNSQFSRLKNTFWSANELSVTQWCVCIKSCFSRGKLIRLKYPVSVYRSCFHEGANVLWLTNTQNNLRDLSDWRWILVFTSDICNLMLLIRILS